MNRKDIQVLVRGYKNFRGNIDRCIGDRLQSHWGIEFLGELLFPNTCLFCQKLSPQDICEVCTSLYPISDAPRCMNCGKFIIGEEKELCQQCSVKQFYFDQGGSLWLHGRQVKRAVYRFKYSNHRIYGKYFAQIMVNNYRNKIIAWRPDCVIAIPVHQSRLKSRGFNQAEVLALDIVEEISLQIGVTLPYVKDLVTRNKSTTFQKLLDSNQRASNLKGVFRVNMNMELPEKVLIIDDIYTTGATINEVAKILKKSGVKEVCFLTISIGQGF